jgi:hypothetical protein
MRHGSEGWKCLETSMRALAALMEGAGPGARGELDSELRELLYRCGSGLPCVWPSVVADLWGVCMCARAFDQGGLLL